MLSKTFNLENFQQLLCYITILLLKYRSLLAKIKLFVFYATL